MKRIVFAKKISLLLMILTISLSGFSKEKEVKSLWAASSVKIDGFKDDWAKVAFANEKKTKIDYAFKNDAENLYVLYIFKDPKYLTSISVTGLTLWFNSEGKKKKKYGIKFIQKQISADALISRTEKERGPLPEDKKKEIRNNPFYLINDTEIVNKKSKSLSQPSESSKIKPAVFRVMKQQNLLVFEFAIPLKRMMEQTSGAEIEPGKRVKVGFEWGGMTEEMKAEAKRRSAALERTRTTSSDPADNRAGAGAGSSVPMGLLSGPKKYSFWVDVQLAKESVNEKRFNE
jgi:hypothetical protein